MRYYLLFLLLLPMTMFGANIDYRSLNTNQFTTNIPSPFYVGIRGYGVTNIPGTNINISAGGSVTFVTNGANITISVTGLGQATNVFLIAGTNVNIITNGSGTWTISGQPGFWRTNAADGAILNINGSADSAKFGSVNSSSWIKTPNTSLQLGDVDGVGNSTKLTLDDTINQLKLENADLNLTTGLYYGNGTALTNLDGSAIDIVYGSGLTAVTNVHQVTITASGGSGGTFVTNVVTTNTPAGVTNFVDSEINNQIPNFIHGTTNFIAKFTPNTNTVGDSIIQELGTNALQVQSRKVSSTWTNELLLRFLSENTSVNNWRALDIFAPTNKNGLAYIDLDKGSGSTDVFVGLQLLRAWTINGVGTVAAGGHNGDLLPAADDAVVAGNTSLRIKQLVTGSNGLLMSENTSAPNVNSIGANGYGMAITTTGIDMYKTASGTPAITGTYRQDPGGSGLYGWDVGVGYFGGGGTIKTPVAFLLPISSGIWQLGTNNTGTVVNQRLRASNGSGADKQGADLQLSGGAPSGTNFGGSVRLQTAESASSTSSTVQTLRDRTYIGAHPVTLTTNSATGICTITLPTSITTLGCKVFATTEINNGTDMAYVSEEFAWGAYNKAGTLTTKVSASAVTVADGSGGAAVTTTWTATASGTTITLKVNAVTSGISASTAITRWRLETDSSSVIVITPL